MQPANLVNMDLISVTGGARARSSGEGAPMMPASPAAALFIFSDAMAGGARCVPVGPKDAGTSV